MEREKVQLTKVQKQSERILKQLEESTNRVAQSEAEFRVKERNFKDQEEKLNVEIQKLRSQIERQKNEIKEQMAKVNEKVDYKEKVLENKLADKNRDYQLRLNAIKIDIEDAQKKLKDNEKVLEIEFSIRKFKDDRKLTEENIRKLESQLNSINLDIAHEKDTTTELQEQIEETEKSNKQLSTYADLTDQLEQDLKKLSTQQDQIEKDLNTNKDNSDLIISLKSNLRSMKNRNEDLVHERERLEKNLSRVKAGFEPLKEGERDSSVSRLEKVEKESAYEKYGRAGRTADRGQDDKKAADARQAREDEKKIRDLKTEIKTLKREKERDIDNINKKLVASEQAIAKAQSALNKIEHEKKGIQKLIKQEKEVFSSNLNVLKEESTYFTQKNSLFETELKKMKKAYQDTEFNLAELRRQIESNQKLLAEKTKYYEDNEIEKNSKQRNVDKIDKELATEFKNYTTLNEKLLETELTLLSFEQQVKCTKIEFKNVVEDTNHNIHALEGGIYYENDQNLLVERVIAELKQELAALNWYFVPLKEKGLLETQWYSTTDYDFIVERKKKRDAELAAIKEEIQNTSLDYKQKDLEAEDFKRNWERALESMNNEDRGDLLFEIKDLMEAFKMAEFKQRTVLQIVSLLAEQQVYAGAVRELALLSKNMNSKTFDQHVMQRPDVLLKVLYRDYARDLAAAKSFRRRLLEKLVTMRMKRTNKPKDYCENVIFYGEEEDN
uniref:Nuf2 DHR10-like domain-containing protein n=1 Tax=Arcella intermedia TaxID=1963864 RepID=A0A6B2KYU5_9EUKA